MIHTKAAFVVFLLLANAAKTHAVLRGNRIPVDPTEELHMMMMKTRILKGADDDTNKRNKNNQVPPTEHPTDPETTPPTASPTSQPTLLPTAKPSAAPTVFDSTISVACNPDGATDLTMEERSAKTIICNSAKPSCREAITAVKESAELQNFFGCAGDLGEGAARKLFNKYAFNDMLAGQLALIAATNAILVTERPDAMKEACAAIAAMQSPPATDPCCQGPSGCTSVTGSASNSPPFMTVTITACTGDSACKDMGPNPLILDSSCTGESACELMNENEINPSITGVTFVGEMACTTPQSCEGVGRRSHGDVTIQTGACVGSEACNAAGRRVVQKTTRIQSHINIGENACVGSNACKDAHSTVNYGTAGKPAGSLTIGAGGCAADGSCEKMGFSDRMRTDLVVPPGGCGSVEGCRGCMTKTECNSDEVYIISDVDGACPKGGSSSGGNPTGDKVDEYCIGKDTLPTDSPTLSPTPFPTPVTSAPTSFPTGPTAAPTSPPTSPPTSAPTSPPTSAPTSPPTSPPTSAPTSPPTSPPTSAPTSPPTITPASFTVGCLETPGDDTSMFNPTDGDVLCDGATGTCADFVSKVDSLDEGKRKMIKSIFGCNAEDPPQSVALEVAQERFDNIRNDESVTKALLDTVATLKLFTGSASVVTSACNGSCCNNGGDCSVYPVDGGVMTVSSGSCTGSSVCADARPNTIILDSCKGFAACYQLGNFNPDHPAAGVEVGFRVIGPGACGGDFSCSNMGENIFGDIRVEEGACNTSFSCSNVALRKNQGSTTTTPIVASVFIGKNACQGTSACLDVHRSVTKSAGSLTIEDGACSGESTCNSLGFIDSATNDVIIRANVCTSAATCTSCAQGPLCESETETYVIDDAATDCPGPSQSACQVL